MNVTEVTKIQVDPELEHLKPKIALAANRQGLLYQIIKLETRVKLALGRFLHPLGIHTWVAWKQYDEASDRIIDTGGVICEFCPKAKL